MTVVVLACFIFYQATIPVVLIEKVEVDPRLKDQLLPEEALAWDVQVQTAEIVGSIEIAYNTALSSSGDRPDIKGENQANVKLPTEVTAVDFQLPTVGISYEKLLDLVRHLIGNDPTRVRVVITYADNTWDDDSPTLKTRNFQELITFINPSKPLVQEFLPEQKLSSLNNVFGSSDELAKSAAKTILKRIDPLLFACYEQEFDPQESVEDLEALPEPQGWERFRSFFPWSNARRRSAFLHGFLAEELRIIKTDDKRAEAEFQRSFRLRPDATVANDYGSFLLELKRYPEAIAWYQRALGTLDGNNKARSLTLGNIGVAEDNFGKTSLAINSYTEAIATDPNDKDNPEPYRALAQSFLTSNRDAEAEPLLRTYTRLAPYDESGFYLLAVDLDRLKRSEEAIALLRLQVGDKAKDWMTTYELALLLDESGAPASEVERTFKKAIDADSMEAEIYLGLADFLDSQDRPKEARQVLIDGDRTMGCLDGEARVKLRSLAVEAANAEGESSFDQSRCH